MILNDLVLDIFNTEPPLKGGERLVQRSYKAHEIIGSGLGKANTDRTQNTMYQPQANF